LCYGGKLEASSAAETLEVVRRELLKRQGMGAAGYGWTRGGHDRMGVRISSYRESWSSIRFALRATVIEPRKEDGEVGHQPIELRFQLFGDRQVESGHRAEHVEPDTLIESPDRSWQSSDAS
jgi:hypothetical protein